MFTPPTLSLEIPVEFSPSLDDTQPLEFSFKDAFDRLVGGQLGMETVLDKLQHDRIFDEDTLSEFLKRKVSPFSENLIDQDPMAALLSLILQDDPSQNELRDRVADAYIEKFPEDDKFEKAYAFTRKPHILLAHLLLKTERWICMNLELEKFYYEQMIDLFQGGITFHKPETLSNEAANRISKIDPTFLEALEDTSEEPIFWVMKTCSTPKLTTWELFIEHPTEEQSGIINEFLGKFS